MRTNTTNSQAEPLPPLPPDPGMPAGGGLVDDDVVVVFAAPVDVVLVVVLVVFVPLVDVLVVVDVVELVVLVALVDVVDVVELVVLVALVDVVDVELVEELEVVVLVGPATVNCRESSRSAPFVGASLNVAVYDPATVAVHVHSTVSESEPSSVAWAEYVRAPRFAVSAPVSVNVTEPAWPPLNVDVTVLVYENVTSSPTMGSVGVMSTLELTAAVAPGRARRATKATKASHRIGSGPLGRQRAGLAGHHLLDGLVLQDADELVDAEQVQVW